MWLRQRYFPMNVANFFKKNFFYSTPLLAAFMSTRKRRLSKRKTKERGKNFQMKKENQNISFSLYLQVLVLVVTEMQIQICKY